MPSYPKNYPFYSWMPKPLGIIILLFFFLPILTVGGVYSVNSTEMMSGLGIISEHIQFANFVTSIGMAAFAPFLYQLVCVRREKMMCIVGFAFMYIFSYICAKTDSVFLLALCSLLTGFLRMVLMMVNLFTLIWYAGGMEATRNITPGLEPKDTAGWNKLDIERCVSQPAVYLFFMILGQSGTALTAWLSFEYEWKYVYYFMMGFFFLSLSAVFMYFEVQTAGVYERLKYAVIIRATGMMILYALTAAYANQRMPFKYLSTWICIMLTVRMVVGPSIGEIGRAHV